MSNPINSLTMTADVYQILPILGGEKIAPSESLMKYGINSLDIVNLLIGLENKYGIKFNLRNVKISDITVCNLAKMVAGAKSNVDIQTRIVDIMRDMFGKSVIEPDKPLRNYGIDYMDVMDLLNRVEGAFGLPLAAIGDCIDAKHGKNAFVRKDIFPSGFYDAYISVCVDDLVRIVSGLMGNTYKNAKNMNLSQTEKSTGSVITEPGKIR